MFVFAACQKIFSYAPNSRLDVEHNNNNFLLYWKYNVQLDNIYKICFSKGLINYYQMTTYTDSNDVCLLIDT